MTAGCVENEKNGEGGMPLALLKGEETPIPGTNYSLLFKEAGEWDNYDYNEAVIAIYQNDTFLGQVSIYRWNWVKVEKIKITLEDIDIAANPPDKFSRREASYATVVIIIDE